MFTRFRDRSEAGRRLATMLLHIRTEDVIVLALPRGGVPIGYEIARTLGAPLDVFNVRKLGVPWQEELAMGAIAAGGVQVLNNEIIMALGITRAILDEVTAQQRTELERRERVYRGGRAAPVVTGRTIVLVDDGIATGATVRAAISVIRSKNPARLILATPVAQASVAADLAREVDELVCLARPGDLGAIGMWYEHFDQLTDREVQETLTRAAAEHLVSRESTQPAGAHADADGNGDGDIPVA